MNPVAEREGFIPWHDEDAEQQDRPECSKNDDGPSGSKSDRVHQSVRSAHTYEKCSWKGQAHNHNSAVAPQQSRTKERNENNQPQYWNEGSNEQNQENQESDFEKLLL